MSQVFPPFLPLTAPSLLVQQSFTPKKSLILTASQHPQPGPSEAAAFKAPVAQGGTGAQGTKAGPGLTRRQDMNTGIWIRHEHVNIVNVYVLSKLWVILLPNRT